MLVVSGIVTLFYVIASAIIGVRLLRLGSPDRVVSAGDPPRKRLPEFWLGGYFLLYSCIAAALNMMVYSGWSDPEMQLPVLGEQLAHAGFFWIGGLGLLCLLAFTRLTFRPRNRWAFHFVWIVGGVNIISSLGLGLAEGYRLSVASGSWYWINFFSRSAIFIWITVESLRYWSMLQLRLRLGLADALLTNRFLLMGIWGVVITVLAYVDPIARIWYYQKTGGGKVWDPVIGAPILHFSAGFALVGLSMAACSLYLTFFPTPSYRGWINERAERFFPS